MKWFGANSSKGVAVPTLQGKTIDVGEHRLRVEEHLGEGGFAVIYRVRDVKSGQFYALKHIVMRNPEAKTALKDEAKIMKKVQEHPHIISLYSVAFGPEKEDEQDAFMLMDLCSESLYGYLQKRNFAVSDADILEIFRCVCHAVYHLHSQKHPICHRDIKIENVLRHANGNWVLCDFGSAKARNKTKITHQNAQYEQQEINKTTTPAYRAPEMWDVLMGQPVDERADIWALGWESQLEVMAGKTSFPKTRDLSFANTIGAMLNVDPEKRPNVQTVLTMIEDMRLGLKSAQAPAVATTSALEPRSRSATLKSDHAVMPAPPTGNKKSALASHPSLPNAAELTDLLPNSARGAPVRDSKQYRKSMDASAMTPPARVQGNGKPAQFPAQVMKPVTDKETKRPKTPVVPKLPVSPALVGNNKPVDAQHSPLADEVRALKTVVCQLQEQNQLLWKKILALESTVTSQQQAFQEFKQSQAVPATPPVPSVPHVHHVTHVPHGAAAVSPPKKEQSEPFHVVPTLPPALLPASSPTSGRTEAVPVPAAVLSQVPAMGISVAKQEPFKPDHIPIPKEALKTPKSSRFAGTFWTSVVERDPPVPVSDERSDSPEFGGEYENRHKRVVSDPPPLESWHTSGKL